MYTFQNAICLSRSIGSQWKETDLSDILVYDIFLNYSKVFLILHNDVLDEDQYVDMDTLRSEFSSYGNTLEALLVLLGNRTLETVDVLPSSTVKFAKYSDAVRSEYKVEPIIAGRVLPPNFPDGEKEDLKITRPKYTTSMDLLHTHCLVSVNGFFHMTGAANNEAFAYQGAKTMRKCNNNHLGITSFLDIGRLEKIPFDPETIVPVNSGRPLYEKLMFTIDADMENKSYFMILGGYLVFPENGTFWRNGDQSFILDLNRLPYLERVIESDLYLDLSSLGLTPQSIGDPLYNSDELRSDEVIKKYFSLSQSYFVIVDVPHLVTNKIHLRHSSLPGMFTAYQDPVYPLIVKNGKIAEYWKVHEDGHWAVNVQDSFLRNMIISQQPVGQNVTVSGNLVPTKPFHHSRGFLLEIAGYRN